MDSSLPWWWLPKWQNLKDQPCKKYELQTFVFQKVLIRQRLGAFEYGLRCMKWFSRKLLQKLLLAFLFKLRYLKIWLLVTWLRFLLQNQLKSLVLPKNTVNYTWTLKNLVFILFAFIWIFFGGVVSLWVSLI